MSSGTVVSGAPQHTGVSSVLIAHVVKPPALICLTGRCRRGRRSGRATSLPQHTGTPPAAIAQVWMRPALIAVTGPIVGGTSVASGSSPSTPGASSTWIAQVWKPPARDLLRLVRARRDLGLAESLSRPQHPGRRRSCIAHVCGDAGRDLVDVAGPAGIGRLALAVVSPADGRVVGPEPAACGTRRPPISRGADRVGRRLAAGRRHPSTRPRRRSSPRTCAAGRPRRSRPRRSRGPP